MSEIKVLQSITGLEVDLPTDISLVAITALTGDVTASGTGSVAATIAANSVTNAKAAQMPTLTVKGNNTGGTANAQDLTTAQLKAMLNTSPTVQQFTAGQSGTYTKPAGVLYLKIKMVGAGSGGSGSGTTGAGGSSAGGDTTFGSSFLVANGGGAASFNGTSTGGTASITGLTGIAIQGGGGSAPAYNNTAGAMQPCGGNGASSPFGGAGAGGTPSVIGSPTGFNANGNCGSGGGGGGANNSAGASGGTGGAAGGYIEVVVPSPNATYAYSVGSGSAGGSGGAGGASGGSGGGGRIYIEEFYQ